MKAAVGSALVLISAGLALACAIAFQWTTRGDWRCTRMGWHLMLSMISTTVVLTLESLHAVLVGWGDGDPAWFSNVRIGAFAMIPGVIIWRLVVIFDSVRQARRQPLRIPRQRKGE